MSSGNFKIIIAHLPNHSVVFANTVSDTGTELSIANEVERRRFLRCGVRVIHRTVRVQKGSTSLAKARNFDERLLTAAAGAVITSDGLAENIPQRQKQTDSISKEPKQILVHPVLNQAKSNRQRICL